MVPVGLAQKYRVAYVGGTPSRWSALTNDARADPAWVEVYASMEVVQPWTVGRYGTLDAADKWNEVLARDLKTAAANHQLCMPVVLPGFSWNNLNRSGRPQPDPG
jgi:hypothetical protein